MSLIQTIKEFFSNRRASKLAKCALLIRNPKAIKEDRASALDYVAALDSMDDAVPVLLQRFEFSLEHGINDSREKETAYHGILKHGAGVLPLVTDHLRQTTRIAWPIKILKALGSEEEVTLALLAALNFGDTAFDQAQTDKNYDILCYLVDYHRSGLAAKILPFLKDHDERVRFAAVEVLLEQNLEEVAEYLEDVLSDETADNSRLRQTVIKSYVEKKWVVRDPQKFAASTASPFVVDKKGVLTLRHV